MFEKIPPAAMLLIFIGLLLVAPVVLVSFLVGGTVGVFVAVVVLWCTFVTAYIFIMRRYGIGKADVQERQEWRPSLDSRRSDRGSASGNPNESDSPRAAFQRESQNETQ